jgi:GAF domain-containing protein
MLPADRQQALDAIAAELGPMTGRPFGVDEHGQRIEHGTGRLVVGAIETLQDFVQQEAARDTLSLAPDERDRRVREAQTDATAALVTALNAAILDRRYHITAEYLLNEGNNYSYEFRLYVFEFGRAISGDPRFFFHQGPRVIPSALGLMSRPLGTRGTYAILPRLVAKVIKTDLQIADLSDRSATVHWHAASQLKLVPQRLHQRYTRLACEVYQGTFASVPTFGGNLPGSVHATQCQADGAPYCEWIFTWEEAATEGGRQWLFAGAGGTVALLAAATRQSPRAALAAIGALLPAATGYLLNELSTARWRGDRLQQRLEEQQTLAEQEYDANSQHSSELQSANVELEMKLSELTTLHQLSVATQATLHLDEVLDQSLATLVNNLSFERALVLLVDDERQVLTRGRSLGSLPDQAQLVATLEVDLNNSDALFANLLRADQAMLYSALDQSDHEPTRDLARAMGASSVLGAPLITKGERVGILAVDNGRTDRPLAEADRNLLFAVASQIAGAVGSARLYEAVEQQNQSLQREVRELRIEIDDTRKSSQVAEITGSDYFQDLRQQAIQLRGALGIGTTED